MAKINNNGKSHLISSKEEFVKQHIILDAQQRTSIVVMAPVNARVGDLCPATSYKYVSISNSTVTDRAEALTQWKQVYEDEYVILRDTIEAL